MIISKFLLSLAFLLPTQTFAKSGFSTQLLSVVDSYNASKLVTMKVLKVVKSEVLDKKTEYSGTISLSKEKFRLDTETPDKALILFDGKVMWSIQYPPKEFGGSAQVLKSKLSKQNRSQILLSALLDKSSLKENFKVTSEELKKSEALITIMPLTTDLTVKKITLTIDTKSKLLKQISYDDEIGNLTTMTFSEIKFPSNIPKNLFKAQIPKDAQVTEL